MTRSMSVQTLMSQFVTPDGVPPWIGAICGSVAFPGSALIWRSKLLRSFALSHHLQHTARVWACRSVKLCQALSISPSYFQSSAPVCLNPKWSLSKRIMFIFTSFKAHQLTRLVVFRDHFVSHQVWSCSRRRGNTIPSVRDVRCSTRPKAVTVCIHV